MVLFIANKSLIHFRSVKPNGVTRLERIHPFMTPRMIQKPLMITRTKARLRNRYTRHSDENTINALYRYAPKCPATNEQAERKFLLEIISTTNTIRQDANAWKTSEYLFKKAILRMYASECSFSNFVNNFFLIMQNCSY